MIYLDYLCIYIFHVKDVYKTDIKILENVSFWQFCLLNKDVQFIIEFIIFII